MCQTCKQGKYNQTRNVLSRKKVMWDCSRGKKASVCTKRRVYGSQLRRRRVGGAARKGDGKGGADEWGGKEKGMRDSARRWCGGGGEEKGGRRWISVVGWAPSAQHWLLGTCRSADTRRISLLPNVGPTSHVSDLFIHSSAASTTVSSRSNSSSGSSFSVTCCASRAKLGRREWKLDTSDPFGHDRCCCCGQ